MQAMTEELYKKEIRVGNGSLSPENANTDIQLVVLPRFDVTPLYILK